MRLASNELLIAGDFPSDTIELPVLHVLDPTLLGQNCRHGVSLGRTYLSGTIPERLYHSALDDLSLGRTWPSGASRTHRLLKNTGPFGMRVLINAAAHAHVVASTDVRFGRAL